MRQPAEARLGISLLLAIQLLTALASVGLLLRVEYEKLPEEHQLAREIGRRREDISDAAYQVVVLQIQRDEVGDVGARVQAFLESQSAELDAAHEILDQLAQGAPDMARVHAMRAFVYEKQGNATAASQEMTQAREDNPRVEPVR